MNVQYGNDELEGDDRLAFQFSQQSYKKANERGNVGDYEYDPSLSNVDTAVWHSKKDKKTHVSIRGSTSAYDWLVSDAQIATGTEDRGSRFKRAVETTKQAHDKYGYNVSTSGHSLGAKLPRTPRRSWGTSSGTMGARASIRAIRRLGAMQSGRNSDANAEAKTHPLIATSKRTSKNAGITCLQRTWLAILPRLGWGETFAERATPLAPRKRTTTAKRSDG